MLTGVQQPRRATSNLCTNEAGAPLVFPVFRGVAPPVAFPPCRAVDGRSGRLRRFRIAGRRRRAGLQGRRLPRPRTVRTDPCRCGAELPVVADAEFLAAGEGAGRPELPRPRRAGSGAGRRRAAASGRRGRQCGGGKAPPRRRRPSQPADARRHDGAAIRGGHPVGVGAATAGDGEGAARRRRPDRRTGEQGPLDRAPHGGDPGPCGGRENPARRRRGHPIAGPPGPDAAPGGTGGTAAPDGSAAGVRRPPAEPGRNCTAGPPGLPGLADGRLLAQGGNRRCTALPRGGI